jgi:hypothetical protein
MRRDQLRSKCELIFCFFFTSLGSDVWGCAPGLSCPRKNLIVVWKKYTERKRKKSASKSLIVRNVSLRASWTFCSPQLLTRVCSSLSLVYNGLAYTPHTSGKFLLLWTNVCKLCQVIALSRGSVVSAVQYTKVSRRERVYFAIWSSDEFYNLCSIYAV